MRKNKMKLNKLRDPTFSTIIRQSMTTKSDLEKILNKFKITDCKISWLKDYDPNYRGPQILNMGNPNIGGSHWVGAYNGKYFDSFGIIPPPNLTHLEWTPLQIQDIDEGRCGQWVVLWIYYVKKNDLPEFYSMFDIKDT